MITVLGNVATYVVNRRVLQWPCPGYVSKVGQRRPDADSGNHVHRLSHRSVPARCHNVRITHQWHHTHIRFSSSQQPQMKIYIYTVSQKKTSHFNFRHNFAICWDILTIFEAPCSGLIARSCSLSHTHHRCEAFTWRDVTHDVIQAVAHCALTPDFIPPDLWPLNSPYFNPVDYSFWSIMQEKMYQTHIANIDELKHRLVQVWAGIDQRHIAAAIGPRRRHLNAWLVCENSRGIFWTRFALNLHVALWASCWIVGLCNI